MTPTAALGLLAALVGAVSAYWAYRVTKRTTARERALRELFAELRHEYPDEVVWQDVERELRRAARTERRWHRLEPPSPN